MCFVASNEFTGFLSAETTKKPVRFSWPSSTNYEMSFGLFNRFHSSRPKLCPLLIQMIVLEKSSNRLQFNNPKNIALIIDISHESGHSYKNHLSEDAQLMVETRARVLIHCMEKHVMNLQTNCVLFDSVH